MGSFDHRSGPRPGSLVFALNGNRVELKDVDPSMTLVSYLRNEAGLPGTKLGCGEGGCGACVVLVSKYDSSRGDSRDFTVNSCLVPLCSIHGCAVTTIEGLGNSQDGFHSIQKRFAGFHGSQCGFCTPGMCMSLYGAMRSSTCQSGDGFRTVDLEKSIASNICRCTGYRPISDVCKSFAGDGDLEDIGINTYWKLGDEPDRRLLPEFDPASEGGRFPEFLVQEQHHQDDQSLVLSGSRQRWIRPASLNEVFALIDTFQDRARLVAGNTSTGIYKDDLRTSGPEVFVEIGAVPELLQEKVSKDGIEIGAAVKISRLGALLDEAGPGDSSGVARKLAEHLNKVASLHVRNAGTVGGNLIMTQKLGFHSDVATVLIGSGALVKVVANKSEEKTQTLEEFVASSWDGKKILKSIFVPSYKKQGHSVTFETYRASPRPFGNAVAYVNAAFLVNISSEGRVSGSRLVFGAFGGEPPCQRATEAENYLEGKVIDNGVIAEAIRLTKVSIVPKRGTTKPGYRASLIASFLFKFLSTLISPISALVPASQHEDHDCQDGHAPKISRKIMSGKQVLQEHTQGAVGHPVSKVMGELQASGEAVYVDDIPLPRDCVHAVFVYSTKALAKIKGIKLKNALSSPDAVSFVGINDIPSGGSNSGIVTDLSQEQLFAIDKVECVGQAVGLMVGNTLKSANAAAGKVEIDYEESLGSPVLTMEEAIDRKEFYDIPPFVKSIMQNKVGNVSEEMAKASCKIENAEVKTGSQYFFYMEPQTALVVPDEDNCFVVYSSCQSPDFVQHGVAKCLGLPMHNIRVITRRVGGGFGGKGTKACLVATACALAAYKLRRPVRLTLDRNTDMIMMGGRHPMKAVYNVGFEPDGTIRALDAKVYIQGGWSPEFSYVMPLPVVSSMKKINWGAFSIEIILCRTNTPSKTVMRGPGDVQGCFFADAVIEHVAAIANVRSELVMEKNLHSVESAVAAYGKDTVGGEKGYTLPKVWSLLKDRAKVDARVADTERYNANNIWKKRGMAVSLCAYVVQQRYQPGRVTIMADGSIAVEVGGVEIGQGLWTKVKQATASAISEPLGVHVDVSKVRVVQADTISMPHGGWTGGSTTSEASCQAVRQCCAILVDRFKPIQEKSGEEEELSWESLVLAAKTAGVDLAAQTAYVSSPESQQYISYGVAASEVEVDVLTGEYEILKTDIAYDCGKSINPAVDIGQIEGAFAQGVGFFTCEEHLNDEQGKLVTDGTWTYKPPTLDCLPRQINVELLNSEVHEHRILSSKASGEPPLLLASSVHGAIRHAILAARKHLGNPDPYFQLDAPATIDKVRILCGVDNIECHLKANK